MSLSAQYLAVSPSILSTPFLGNGTKDQTGTANDSSSETSFVKFKRLKCKKVDMLRYYRRRVYGRHSEFTPTREHLGTQVEPEETSQGSDLRSRW